MGVLRRKPAKSRARWQRRRHRLGRSSSAPRANARRILRGNRRRYSCRARSHGPSPSDVHRPGRPFRGASLLGSFGSLLGRFNSLIGRLGNLPMVCWNTNGLAGQIRAPTGPKSSFCQFFPVVQGSVGCRRTARSLPRLVWTAPATGGELAPAPHLSKTAFGGKGGGVDEGAPLGPVAKDR